MHVFAVDAQDSSRADLDTEQVRSGFLVSPASAATLAAEGPLSSLPHAKRCSESAERSFGSSMQKSELSCPSSCRNLVVPASRTPTAS